MNSISLANLLARGDEDLAELENFDPIAEDDLPEEELVSGVVVASFKKHESFVQMTGYNEAQITSWLEEMRPIELNSRTRGPAPKSSLADSLLCYLVLLKSDVDLPALSKTLKLS